MRHAGMGYPNGSVDNHWIFSLPSPSLLMLITEARYHHDAAVDLGKEVAVRAIPRRGSRPAELGWSPERFVREVLDKTEEIKRPIRDFIPWNELDLQDERGDAEDDWSGLENRYGLIGGWGLSVLLSLGSRLPSTTQLHFPAFTPDHNALDYLAYWQSAAELCDVIDFHAYDTLGKIQTQYAAYRAAFPDKPLALTEWHCRGDLEEERHVLMWLAQQMQEDPLFDAAYFFIWRWHDHPGWWQDAWDVEHTSARFDLFADPPRMAVVEVPVPDPVPEEPLVMQPNPYEFWSAEQIADAADVPLDAVLETWPAQHAQLIAAGINDMFVQVGMIGTIKVETGIFRPVREGFYLGEPEPAESHRRALDYYPYYGRGLIQNTHKANYRVLGPKIAELWGANPADSTFDLVSNPDNLLNLDISSAAAAIFFRDTQTIQGYSIIDACRDQDWEWVRRLVLGGPDPAGTAKIQHVADMLLLAPVETGKVRYNALEPAHPQNKSFDCSQESLEWAMFALGRTPDDTLMTQAMIDQGVMSENDGLLDATGAGLAKFVGDYWGEFGFYANNEPYVTFNFVAAEGDHAYPLLIGGRSWNHWSGVRGYDAQNDLLLLANPSDGHHGVHQTMDRNQFAAQGNFSMVRVLHPDLLEPAAPPAPPAPPVEEPKPDPVPTPPPSPDAEILQLRAALETLLTKQGYLRDTVGPALRKELATIQNSLDALESAIETFEREVKGD